MLTQIQPFVKLGSYGVTRTLINRLTAERPTIGRHRNTWRLDGELNSDLFRDKEVH